MSDERDRRAAEEWLDANDGPAVPPRSAVDSLAAFRAAARAEGAAEAIEAVCAKCYVCNGTGRRRTSCSMCGDSTFDHECDDRYVPCKWCAGIRALAPAGLVAVATDDLEWLLSEADTCEMRMPTSNPRLREERDEIVTRVRAALARKEG